MVDEDVTTGEAFEPFDLLGRLAERGDRFVEPVGVDLVTCNTCQHRSEP